MQQRTARSFIDKTIEINALPVEVWRVFTDPLVTRQMGGEYVTNWETGSPFGWKGSDGMMYTNGIILQIEPGVLLQHSLFDPGDNTRVASIITYHFIDKGGGTILSAREELFTEMNESEYKDASEGWDAALGAVKKIAEEL